MESDHFQDRLQALFKNDRAIVGKLKDHDQQLDDQSRNLAELELLIGQMDGSGNSKPGQEELLLKIREMHQREGALAFLRQEYFHVNSIQDNFDQKALTIKAWSVTFSMVGIGAGFYYRIPVLLFLSGAASLLFWIVEAYWKKNQKCYYDRVSEIENAMQRFLEDDSNGLPEFPRISTSWNESRKKISVLERALKLHVMLPHLAVVLFGIAAGVALLLWPEFIDHEFLGGDAPRSIPPLGR